MPTDKSHPLYFIAIIPSEPLASELMQLKEYFRDHYNSKASLNSPPHITLHMPFRWKDQRKEELWGGLTEVAHESESFTVELQNFNAFAPRVIFVDVLKNPALEKLQQAVSQMGRRKLKLDTGNYKGQAFHPHITLAFRDLRKPMFREAWSDFSQRSFTGNFKADHLVLLKHSGKNWEVHERFKFGKTNVEVI